MSQAVAESTAADIDPLFARASPPGGREQGAEHDGHLRQAVEQLDDYLARTWLPRTAGALTREHVESFLIDLQRRGFRRPPSANASAACSSTSAGSPRARDRGQPDGQHAPAAGARGTAAGALARRAAGVAGHVHRQRRGSAPRYGHPAALRGQRHAPRRAVRAAPRGSRPRCARCVGDGQGPSSAALPFDKHTAAAIDRYLRLRNRRADADSPWLWLGRKAA